MARTPFVMFAGLAVVVLLFHVWTFSDDHAVGPDHDRREAADMNATVGGMTCLD